MTDPHGTFGTNRGVTYVVPGPGGPGHPDYEIGFKHGADGRDAVSRDDATYMNGWADGRASLECDRGPCYLGANHAGDCKPGPGRLLHGSDLDSDDSRSQA